MKKPKQGRRKRQKELEAKANKKRFPKLSQINLRRDGIGLLLLFVGVFALFAISAPRTIILEDDGLFVSVAWFAGVAHPPGYPLYTILGWISSHLLPFGEIPWRVHIVSGFMGAVTCICIAWIVLRRTGNRPAAYLAGAALAVSEHFWSQAIIPMFIPQIRRCCSWLWLWCRKRWQNEIHDFGLQPPFYMVWIWQIIGPC